MHVLKTGGEPNKGNTCPSLMKFNTLALQYLQCF